MKKTLYFFLTFTFLFAFSSAFSMQRDYSKDEYCAKHTLIPYNQEVKQKYGHLIPPLDDQCWKIHCSVCEGGYAKRFWFLDEQGNYYPKPLWTCSCFDDYPEEDSWKESWSNESWSRCDKNVIYHGYFSIFLLQFFNLFEHFLEYCNSNPSCYCYWPELSQDACFINDTAYCLFKDLIISTSLSLVVEDSKEQAIFLERYNNDFNLHGVTINAVCHCFFYTDYRWVCRTIESYSRQKFEGKKLEEILERLEDIRYTLAKLFYPLYMRCLKEHPSKRIQDELLLLNDEFNFYDIFNDNNSYCELEITNTYELSSFTCSNNDECDCKDSYDMKKSDKFEPQDFFNKNIISKFDELQFIHYNNQNRINKDYSEANNFEVLLALGTFYNDCLLYKSAIEILNLAITLNPNNRDSYIERAAAYFELGNIDEALKDYERAKASTAFIFPQCTLLDLNYDDNIVLHSLNLPEEKIEFSKGFVFGAIQGISHAVEVFVPEALDCLSGLSHGTWALACNPVTVSGEIYESLQQLIYFLRHEPKQEVLEALVPELRVLCQNWDNLSEYDRGKHTGFIVGKYGIDIFAPGAIVKTYKKYRYLKRMNTLFTVECCYTSVTQRKTIVDKALAWIKKRTQILASIGKERVIPRNSNVMPHVMQKKHGWEKLITLSGNMEKDFQEVINILEKSGILAGNLVESYPIVESAEQIIGKIFQVTVNDLTIEAQFLYYIETDQLFLNNAFIIINH